MSFVQLALAVFAIASLSACAGRPQNAIIPTHVRPSNTDVVDLMIATTRSRDAADPAAMFSGERGGDLEFAEVSVSIPRDGYRQVGEVQWPEGPNPDPMRSFTTVEARILSKDAAIAEFDKRIQKTPKRQVLIFVHGFNTRFQDAVFRFAQIVHDSRASVTPVLFTWPSRGRLLQYGYDHESANYSRDALERVLQALQRDRNVGEISILAHSMGNWVTLEALRQMAIRNGGIAPKIRNVMLAAPDVDFDVFRKQIAAMNVRPSIFTLFVSRDDEALAVSKRVWGDKPRLGAVDARAEPFREVLDRDRVQVLDLTDVPSGDKIGHTKFAEAPEVVKAIGGRLATGQALSDAQLGVGDRLGLATSGAVSTLGHAAGAAVAVPFAIVDPVTRENLSDHFDAAGIHAESAIDAGAGALTKTP